MCFEDLVSAPSKCGEVPPDAITSDSKCGLRKLCKPSATVDVTDPVGCAPLERHYSGLE